MPRLNRLIYPGAFYHIMCRGNEKGRIFRTYGDRQKFLKYLFQYSMKNKVSIHGYCLMDNHFHLIPETPKANISIYMQELLTSYAIYFNKKHNRVGHLFQGRYKAKIVEQDQYLCELSRYIHRNPIEAGKEIEVNNYLWSSYCYFVSRKLSPPWLVQDETLRHFGFNKKTYQWFVLSDLRKDGRFLKMIKRGDFIGSHSFIKRFSKTPSNEA